MTKINILHVAINYIRALESILETGDAGIQVYGTSVVQSPNLPLSPECEPPMEKVAKNPPKTNPNSIRKATLKKVSLVTSPPTSTTTSTRTKNPSSSSSSVDSGISLDQDSDQEPDEIICPDWTELTSTLELFPSRGNLDTLLSSAASDTIAAAKILQPRDLNRSNSKLLDLNFFDDLNSSYDSLADSEGMIPFEEDPFQLVF